MSVYASRKAHRRAELARKKAPSQADVVVPVPDSGVPAAIGYAAGRRPFPSSWGSSATTMSGAPSSSRASEIRNLGVKLKHNANRGVIDGKPGHPGRRFDCPGDHLDQDRRNGAQRGRDRGPHAHLQPADDCTGLATGGNKTRKLEYLLGDAQARGADTLITEGGVQSNHCRQTVAAATRCSMDCVLVLNRGYANEETGNLLLDRILGAEIVVVEDSDDREAAVERVKEDLRARGKHPYVVPTGGSNGIGAMGYANFVREAAEQALALGVTFDAIVTASGSGGTHGGLVLGRKLFGTAEKIVGISDGEPREELCEVVLQVAREGAELLGSDLQFSEQDVTILDEYYGEGYGIPTPEMVEAVRLVAQTEGILLDPVYNGKAMAGLIDLVRKGAYGPDQSVLFIHTGGTPALFAYRDSFLD